MTKVVNFLGGPGVGKTLVAALTFGKMKLLGLEVEYVQEYAKKLVWLNDMFRFNDQYYISIKQFELLKSVDGQVDYIVMDGSLLLGLYYNRYHTYSVSSGEKAENVIINCYNQFDNINIYIKRNIKSIYETAGRVQTYEEAVEVDAGVLKLLEEHRIPYKKFESTEEEVSNIINYILGDKNRQNKVSKLWT